MLKSGLPCLSGTFDDPPHPRSPGNLFRRFLEPWPDLCLHLSAPTARADCPLGPRFLPFPTRWALRHCVFRRLTSAVCRRRCKVKSRNIPLSRSAMIFCDLGQESDVRTKPTPQAALRTLFWHRLRFRCTSASRLAMFSQTWLKCISFLRHYRFSSSKMLYLCAPGSLVARTMIP